MTEAVIVSTARTPIGKAYRGAFNDTAGRDPAAATSSATRCSAPASTPEEVDDVVMGAALQQGATGRQHRAPGALRAGLPVTVAGMTIDRQCASGLMAIAIAAQLGDRSTACEIAVGGGWRVICLVQNEHDEPLPRPGSGAGRASSPTIYMPMLETAEVVAERYGISPRAPGRVRAAIASSAPPPRSRPGGSTTRSCRSPTEMAVADKATGETSRKTVTLAQGRRQPRPTPRWTASPR